VKQEIPIAAILSPVALLRRKFDTFPHPTSLRWLFLSRAHCAWGGIRRVEPGRMRCEGARKTLLSILIERKKQTNYTEPSKINEIVGGLCARKHPTALISIWLVILIERKKQKNISKLTKINEIVSGPYIWERCSAPFQILLVILIDQKKQRNLSELRKIVHFYFSSMRDDAVLCAFQILLSILIERKKQRKVSKSSKIAEKVCRLCTVCMRGPVA
jgi:hypothetical protein